MTLYVKLLTIQNLVHFLPCQLANWICHHIVIVILTQLTMLTTINAPRDNAVTHLAACTVALAAVIAIMMIVLTAAPQVMTKAATMLIIMSLPSVGSLILETVNQLVTLTLPLKSCHIPKDLIILPGSPTHTKILITPLILMVMAIAKIPRQPLITQLLPQTMNPMKNLILVTRPQQTCLQHLT